VIGRSLAHYRITASIGAGGMGEVYRATDTKLGRDVVQCIKGVWPWPILAARVYFQERY